MKEKLLTLKFAARATATKIFLAPLKLFHNSCKCQHVILVHGYDGCNLCDCTYFEKSAPKK